MHCSYRDITAPLGAPRWWDENAVPRYCDFHPDYLANIYGEEAALVALKCASCGVLLPCALSKSRFHVLGDGSMFLASGGLRDAFYGDPPHHSCEGGGDSMTADIYHVIEKWTRREHDWRKETLDSAPGPGVR